MDIILLVMLAVNLAATCWYGQQLLRREEYRVEFIRLPDEFISKEVEPEPEQKEISQPEAQESTSKATSSKSYSAWENRTNIPWVESNRPVAAPPVSLSKEPLARPDGFV